MVRAAFYDKGKARLRDQVGRWKGKWIDAGRPPTGEAVKPLWMSSEIWKQLVEYWMDPTSEQKRGTAQASRNTPRPDGEPPSTHGSGQWSFRRRGRDMVSHNFIFVSSFSFTHSRLIII